MDDGLSDSRRQLLWHPTAIQAWAWGMPGIMLKLGIGAFLMGLLFDLWGAVSSEALQWQNSDVKVKFLSHIKRMIKYAHDVRLHLSLPS
jgi:hypothetical protein